MRVLYVFPHPDDESYGPAPVMSYQRRHGHQVFLLTLTRGGATRQRHRYGYSIAEMGQARAKEMECVARMLDLSGLTVLDLPDSGLKALDPREIERPIGAEIQRLQPQVVVTYAVYGVSGFEDHLVTHAVVKRAYVELAEKVSFLRRLAFYTIPQEAAAASPHFPLRGTAAEEIGCRMTVDEADVERTQQALDCYVTYQQVIAESGIRDMVSRQAVFEIFRERHDPPLDDLLAGLS